jgi:hypothetical protein
MAHGKLVVTNTCKVCKEGTGTALFIKGAVPQHATQEHWHWIRAHGSAKVILSGLIDLVGAPAIIQAVAHWGLSDVDRAILKKMFKELAQVDARSPKD